MKINVKYDQYNTKIESSVVEYSGIITDELTFVEEIINVGTPTEETIKKLQSKFSDGLGVDIISAMTKEEVKTYITLLRNMIAQM